MTYKQAREHVEARGIDPDTVRGARMCWRLVNNTTRDPSDPQLELFQASHREEHQP